MKISFALPMLLPFKTRMALGRFPFKKCAPFKGARFTPGLEAVLKRTDPECDDFPFVS
jgi:hypothetical protein